MKVSKSVDFIYGTPTDKAPLGFFAEPLRSHVFNLIMEAKGFSAERRGAVQFFKLVLNFTVVTACSVISSVMDNSYVFSTFRDHALQECFCRDH